MGADFSPGIVVGKLSVVEKTLLVECNNPLIQLAVAFRFSSEFGSNFEYTSGLKAAKAFHLGKQRDHFERSDALFSEPMGRIIEYSTFVKCAKNL